MYTNNEYEEDDRILNLKKKNHQLHRKCNKLEDQLLALRIITLICVILTASAFTFTGIKVNKLQAKIDSQQKEISTTKETLEAKNADVIKAYDNLYADFTKLSQISVALNNSNKELLAAYSSDLTELKDLRSRKEIYDSYSYALYNNGKKTDINISDIKDLKVLCKEKGMDDKVPNLICAIAMTESGGNGSAKNPTSTASGVGGFLKSTGSKVYSMMGCSPATYVHSKVTTNVNTSLKMMAYYIDYLYANDGNNIYKILRDYRGIDDPAYYAKINKYLSTVGLSVDDITIKDSNSSNTNK